jgi:hypothetical protein
MSRINTQKNLRPTTIALLVAAFACLGLAACGSSSGGSSSTATTTAAKTTAEVTTTPTTTTPESTTPTTTTPASTTPEAEASRAHRRQLAASVAKCLRAHGAQIAEPSAEGFLKVEGPATRTPQFHAAVTKCHSVIAEAFAGASSNSGKKK